jgi:hypothetical protein
VSSSVSSPFTVSIVQTSALVQASNALAPGQSTTMIGGTDGTTGMVVAAFQTIQWMNRFHYDHTHQSAHLIGKDPGSTGSARSNNVYSAADNAWMTTGAFHIDGVAETGHIYESFAFDPDSRTVYTGRWNSGDIQSWTWGAALTSWQVATTAPFVFSATNATQAVLLWHPTLFGTGDGGLIAFRLTGGANVAIVGWRKSTDTWSTLGTTTASGGSPQLGAMEFVRSGGYAIVTSATGSTFRIGAGSGGTAATPEPIANPPIVCRHAGGTTNVGILIDDPGGAAGPYILEKAGTNRVWRLVGDAWQLQGFTHPFPNGTATTNTNWCVASLYPLGAFWGVKNSAGSRLWKPNE